MCNKEYCLDCAPIKHCDRCDKNLCSGCTTIKVCQDGCRDCFVKDVVLEKKIDVHAGMIRSCASNVPQNFTSVRVRTATMPTAVIVST